MKLSTILMIILAIMGAVLIIVGVTSAEVLTNTPTPVITDTPIIPVLTPVVDIGTVIDLNEGITQTGDTTVVMEEGEVGIKLTDDPDVNVTTSTNVSGEQFIPAKTEESGPELIWKSGEKFLFIFDDPVVTIKYQYTGTKLKESIILTQDRTLSFPIELGRDSEIVELPDGQHEIKSLIGEDSIVITKPYGIDAANKIVDMEYVYKDGAMDLIYDKVAHSSKITSSTQVIPANGNPAVKVFVDQELSPISYPLTINSTKLDGVYNMADTSYSDIVINDKDTKQVLVPDIMTGVIEVNDTMQVVGSNKLKTIQLFPGANLQISEDGETIMQSMSTVGKGPVLDIYYGFQKSQTNPWQYYYKVDTLGNPTKVVRGNYVYKNVSISYVNPVLIQNIINSGKIPAYEALP